MSPSPTIDNNLILSTFKHPTFLKKLQWSALALFSLFTFTHIILTSTYLAIAIDTLNALKRQREDHIPPQDPPTLPIWFSALIGALIVQTVNLILSIALNVVPTTTLWDKRLVTFILSAPVEFILEILTTVSKYTTPAGKLMTDITDVMSTTISLNGEMMTLLRLKSVLYLVVVLSAYKISTKEQLLSTANKTPIETESGMDDEVLKVA